MYYIVSTFSLINYFSSLATSGEKASASSLNHEDPHDNDVDQGTSEKAPIATDVSLATARVDTDEDEFQGLDLSVRSRRITSRLFDTKSLETCETGLEQPLDLTCSKPPVTSESLDRESPSSTQLEGVHNEFNYVYVYPGLYPPGSGILPHDEIDSDSPKQVTSPVPELISPGRLSPPCATPRSSLMATSDPLEKTFGLMNPGLAYNNFMNTMAKTALPESISPTPRSTPSIIGIKPEPVERYEAPRKARISPSSNKPVHHVGHQEKGSKTKDKKSNEMKVISENTSYPGVYTSVMKLPWSRRTRTKTKKPKHKVKLEDTLIPQFMLNQSNQNQTSPIPDLLQDPGDTDISTECPASSQSVMMVYPNATSTSHGRPIRRRGRPPKLPMLAKLLQHEQASKRSRKEKKAEQVQGEQEQTAQQVPSSGGMMVYNSGGHVMTAYAGAPPLPSNLQGVPGSTETSTPQPTTIPQMPPQIIPNMSQAQFLGQIPLSQLMGGPVQFLGQFPANALPIPGQTLPGFSIQTQEQAQTGKQDSEENQTVKADGVPNAGFQYAFQPVFIPTPMQNPVQMQQVMTPTSEVIKQDESQDEVSELQTERSPVGIDNHTSPGLNSEGTIDNAPRVISPEQINAMNTMNTTSVANSDTGAMYQEMILSSKSLVNVKKRKRQTAIQLLKSKSNDQNFLCTSFRIRPRLVAQAQAQRERMSVKEGVEVSDFEENDIDSKNLNGPQNDKVHFGENTQLIDVACDQIKRESDFEELYEAYGIDSTDLDIKQEAYTDDETMPVLNGVVPVSKQNKRFMLKGSQKRKAKFERQADESDERERHNTVDEVQTKDVKSEATNEPSAQSGASTRPDMFQELFNCKICNTIIPVHEIESHSLEHVRKNRSASRPKCKTCGGPMGKTMKGANNECSTCRSAREPLIKVENPVFSTYGHGKIACDECPETFKSLPDFYEHKTGEHKNSDPMTLQQGEFECEYCGKVYQYYHALQFHRRTHRERRVACLDKTCKQKFRTRRDMENHFDIAHPDKKEYYHCIYAGCSKKFLKNFHLQEHIRVKHYNIKAFQCPWPGCVKEFAAQRHLKIHLLIHRDEKPMKCDHCDYRCRQRSAMNWHMRKHPDVPYKYKRSSKPPSVSTPESE